MKWSPDGMRVEIIRAGEYEDKELPERVREIATATGIVSDKRTPVARVSDKAKKQHS
ncbi:bacteriophage protein [Escherichia coli]|nr:bacteriophage protein [Escherichia coli]